MNTDKKYNILKHSLKEKVRSGLIVAFSGGVDSGFLLWTSLQVQKRYGGSVLGLTTKSASIPKHDIEDVNEFVDKLNINHIWREGTEIQDNNYLQNDLKRCYYCKFALFDIAKQEAKSKDYKWIAYGYNASDRTDIRPGHQAAIENNILYPLAESELTKDEIRDLMGQHNLNLSDKPSSPCLSSRIMTGIEISKEKLNDIDELEELIRSYGVRIFRLRYHEKNELKYLRLEIAPDEMDRVFEFRDELVKEAKSRGFRWITLDLEGYKMGGGVK